MQAYAGRTIAVTGAAGFLGGCLVRRLAEFDCTILRVARTVLPPLDGAVSATLRDVIGDVRERAVWNRVADADVDVVFHFAADTRIDSAADDLPRGVETNVAPMRHLLSACLERGRAPIVLFAGTVTQAGIASRLPVDEDAVDHPVTEYDRQKLAAEECLKSAAATGPVRGASLRLANVYGPGEHGTHADRDVLNRMIKAAIRGEPLRVFGTGDYLRDYVFIDDVVDAFLIAGACPERVNGRHFVIGSGNGISIRSAFELIAARVEAAAGHRVPVITAEPSRALSALEQRDFIADPSRFAAATGWHPAWSLASGIDRTIEAHRCA
jgi:UDP-glucose 4-epimerase